MERLARLLESLLNGVASLITAPFRWLFRPDPETNPDRAAAAGAADAAAVQADTKEQDAVTAAAKATRVLARILAAGESPSVEELAAAPKMAVTWLHGLTRDQQQKVSVTSVTQLKRVLGGDSLEGVPSILATLARVGAEPEPSGIQSRLEQVRARRAERIAEPLVPMAPAMA